MDTMYIKPADGCLLRDPATGEIIPLEGAHVPLGAYRSYWLRRVKDGDAVACDPPAPAPKSKAAKTAAAAESGAANKE